MQSYGMAGYQDSEVEQDIVAKYSDPTHQDYARQVAQIAGEFSQNLPKGMSPAKEKRRDYKRAARRYISAKAKEKIQPKGFIGGFLFLTIIGAIISYFVQKLMHKYFDEQGTASMENDSDDSD